MAKPLLDDELWKTIEPLIPVKPRRFKHPGRLPRSNRRCLEGILFVLLTGIPWEYLPREFGCCGMTCWRRLRDWQAAGVWNSMHQLLLSDLHKAHQLDRADDARKLAEGDQVIVRVRDLDLDVPGRVARIAPDVDTASQMVFAEIHLEPTPQIAGRLQAGLVVDVRPASPSLPA